MTTQISKAATKMMTTIETLTAKSQTTPLTSHELVRLINARLNVENKTLSGVYKNLFTSPSSDILDLVQLMCGGVVPTFETFKRVMLEKDPNRVHFSNYSGLLAAARLSKSAQAATKVAKQGGTITAATKAKETTSGSIIEAANKVVNKMAQKAKATKVA